MNCPKCGTEMRKSVMVQGIFQVGSITKKWYDGETQSDVNCFGCPNCGYIEFYAHNPKVFEDGSKVKDKGV